MNLNDKPTHELTVQQQFCVSLADAINKSKNTFKAEADQLYDDIGGCVLVTGPFPWIGVLSNYYFLRIDTDEDMLVHFNFFPQQDDIFEDSLPKFPEQNHCGILTPTIFQLISLLEQTARSIDFTLNFGHLVVLQEKLEEVMGGKCIDLQQPDSYDKIHQILTAVGFKNIRKSL